jgi:hypothetical protein
MDQHIHGTIDWLVKDPEVWDWLCSCWAFEDFIVILEWNWHNWLSKPSVHRYDVDKYVCKT